MNEFDSSQENPYASPAMAAEPLMVHSDASGCWRQGNLMVVRVGSSPPPICVKTGTLVAKRGIKRTYLWLHPAWALTFLCGGLLYILIYVLLRKSIKIFVPLSPEGRAQRRRKIRNAWLLGLAGLVLMIAGLGLAIERSTAGLGVMMFITSMVVIIVAAIYGQNAANIVAPVKIDRNFAWFKGVHPATLEQLPYFE
ncbi:MAG: hypothetical protein VXZ82_10885 [Planctomycetota bacterium]|nr:hypothetical protein [Planctomycetota bacterium]